MPDFIGPRIPNYIQLQYLLDQKPMDRCLNALLNYQLSRLLAHLL